MVALFTDEEGLVEIDAMNFFLTIPVWPLTVWNIITSFTERD